MRTTVNKKDDGLLNFIFFINTNVHNFYKFQLLAADVEYGLIQWPCKLCKTNDNNLQHLEKNQKECIKPKDIR